MGPGANYSATVHPPVPVGARTDWKAVFLKLAGAAVPVLTVGAGSPVLMGVLAYRRRMRPLRSFLLWASVGLYLGIAVVFWSIDWRDDQKADSAEGVVAIIFQLLGIVAASVQAAIVIASNQRPVDRIRRRVQDRIRPRVQDRI